MQPQNDEFYKVDVTSAYLYGKLEDTIYMKLPEGMDVKGQGDCLRLLKGIPGLKQSGRCWNAEVVDFFKSHRFTQSLYDVCFFFRQEQDGHRSSVSVAVDDMALTGKAVHLDSLVHELKSRWEVTVDTDPKWFLKMKISRDRTNRSIALSQERYILSMLEKFGMADCKTNNAPTPATHEALDPEAPELKGVPFRELVGSVLYAAVTTRKDILCSVVRVSRFNSRPTIQAWTAAKRILRYLKGTTQYALVLGCVNAQELHLDELVGWADADYAGDLKTRRSTTGGVIQLMGSTLYCRSTLQRSVATSTTEAEYMSICDLAKELKWLMNMLTDMGVTWRAQPRPVPVYEDNQSCIALLKNPGVNHSRSKHVDVKYHFTREQMVNNSLDVIYCPTEDMVADICTKPLPPAKHQKLSALIGMADSP